MAARSDFSPARWRKPFLSWLDGIEEGWAVPLLLSGFVTAWAAYLAIAYVGGDLHADVLEAWTLGRAFEWGKLETSSAHGMGGVGVDVGVSAHQLVAAIDGLDQCGHRP